MSEPFILFGEQHTQALTYSFLIIAVLCVIGNFLSNKVQDIFAKLIGISLLVFEVTKPFIYIYGFDKPWETCLLYTSPSPRDRYGSRMPSSA